jgi:RimJ/RimL family protein N-acetyltransferase
MTELRAERHLLRYWRQADAAPFAALNADPAVMRYMLGLLSRAEADAMRQRISDRLDEQGWGLWAVEQIESGEFLGFVGLAPVAFDAAFTPATEIVWRLAREHWGHGYAQEAATAVMGFAFEELGLSEVVSFTATANERSEAVMARIGMSPDPHGEFDHPLLEDGHPLRSHVLYRLTADAWEARR